ncbi:MAG TPA: SURF1 family protein [Actinomycetota bacterium]|nr:SURF1 family protein [Actinomycetota bacterium]
MYAFARRPRWVLVHAVVLLVVALFLIAGLWQLSRLQERREHNAFVERRRAQPVEPIGSLLATPDEAEQRRVRVTGRYDTGREVVLIGRSNNEKPGNHVLTPLIVEDGHAVIVDRGWVPGEIDKPRAGRAAPPDGEVEVTGIALPSEGRGPLGSQTIGASLPTALSRIDVGRIARALPNTTWPLYVVLQNQEPAQLTELPEPVKLAALEEGPHLAYAIQWFLFIPIAVIGYGALLRRESRKP